MAALTDIVDAVKAVLDEEELSQPFTTERVYIPLYDRTQTPGLKVFLLGLSQVMSDSTRNLDAFTYSLRVAIYCEVEPTNSEVDAMVHFTEEIIDLLRQHRQLNDHAALIGISNDPVYDPAQLDSHHTFVSVVTAEYRSLRPV